MKKIAVGIIGAAGYTGGELLRILIHHPQAEIIFAHSKSNAEKYFFEVHTDLLGDTDLKFSASISQHVDVLFLCLSHGDAKTFLTKNIFPESVKIIDLSQDFRLNNFEEKAKRTFVYGLPELNREAIKSAKNIANPGCFATCIELGLLPLAASNLLHSEIHISATTGSTGAGQSLTETSHFSWRESNVSVYKAFTHQHLKEIEQSVNCLQKGFHHTINFIPYRGNFTRGIFASIYLECELSLEQVKTLYKKFYSEHFFTHIGDSSIHLKQVVNTNKCMIHLEKQGTKILITSCIDNLLKGASGQAVQNMNILFGLEETSGLKLKASAY